MPTTVVGSVAVGPIKILILVVPSNLIVGNLIKILILAVIDVVQITTSSLQDRPKSSAMMIETIEVNSVALQRAGT